MNREWVMNNRIRVVRAEKDLSQAELAYRIGTSRQTIGQIENRTFNPSAKLALVMCRVLNKRFEDLFYLEEEKL